MEQIIKKMLDVNAASLYEYNSTSANWISGHLEFTEDSLIEADSIFISDIKPISEDRELDADTDILLIELCSSGDYSGCDLLGQSNYRSLLTLLEENSAAVTEAIGHKGYWTVTGGYSYQSLALAINYPATLPTNCTDIWQLLNELADYPVVSEEDYSELQIEEEGKYYQEYIAADFLNFLEDHFDGYDFSEVDSASIASLFEQQEPEYIEEGNGVYCDSGRYFKTVTEEEVSKLPGIKLLTE